MMHRPLAVRAWSAALFLLLVASLPLQAQTSELRGRVFGPDGEPVAGVSVVLHRVTDDGGTEVGRAVSDGDGAFVIDAGEVTPGGLYFAATRHDGSLFMGPIFRDLREIDSEYVIVVGLNAVGGAATPGPPPPPGAGRGWLVGLLLGGVGLAFVVRPFLARRRAHPDRAILLELAEIEDRLAVDGPGAEADRERRDMLRARLREL